MATTATFDITSSVDKYKAMMLRKMARMFEREMNRVINEYQEKLRDKLVDIATGYACEVVAEHDDFRQQTKFVVEVRWPDGEGEATDPEAGS